MTLRDLVSRYNLDDTILLRVSGYNDGATIIDLDDPGHDQDQPGEIVLRAYSIDLDVVTGGRTADPGVTSGSVVEVDPDPDATDDIPF